jgi:hypothetical protein
MEELIEGVNAKYCSKCKVLKEYEAFSKNKKEKSGLKCSCKLCDLNYREENREKLAAKRKERHEANKGQRLERVKEHYLVNKEKILANKRKYYEENAECLKEKARLRYLENKADIDEKNKLYYENNKEVITAYKKQHYLLNKDRTASRRKHNGKVYNKNNRPKITANTAKYRAAKKSRTPCWLTDQDFLDIEDFYILAKALTDATGEVYHVDHIIPLQGELVSGFHCPSNLQILTAEENTSKKNKFNPEGFNNGNH